MRLLSRIQGGQNQLETATVCRLDLGGAASLKEAFEPGVPEAHDHLTTSFRKV